uniref:DNA-directed RNA polymerases I, II, and III subunit RPABC1 n=1 Tax=Dermatophagoides pteronyssinus TaxID=6956 RepID=A0A6P6XM77_DERPT|nr:DNA-directed RNA polymerases I, II, and III subunit RPABC1-like [Dermatophagoides pteronyssinus]
MTEDVAKNLWRCRNTCFELLQDRGYIVSNEERNESYENFSKRFAELNYQRSAFSILGIHKDEPNSKIFVYFTDETKKIGVKPIKVLVDQMEERSINYTILIGQQPLTSFAVNTIKDLLPNFHIEFFLESELLVNITKHELVPKHIKLNENEKEAILKQYKISDIHLPRICTTDAVARYLGLRRGDIVKIIRPSESAGKYITYRLCV